MKKFGQVPKFPQEKTNDSHTADGPHSQCLPTLDMVALLACDISENCQLYVLHAMPKESEHTSLKPKLLPAPQILDMCVWLDLVPNLLSILIQMASSLSPWILQKASCGAPGDITTTNNCQTELKNDKYELNDGLEYDILTFCKYTWYSLHLFISIDLREGLKMEHSIFFGDSSSTQ